MSTETVVLNEVVYPYMLSISLHEHPVLKDLRKKTHQLKNAYMQIAPEQGQFMAFLIELIGAKKVLELGTFTGYSALVMALALPDNGQLITCDVNTQYTDIAKPFWQDARMDHKIDLRLAPGIETLQQLLDDGEAETFDFIFIDADKNNYLNYYQLCMKLLRPGGVIAIDNVLFNGRTADPTEQDPQTQSIRSLNQYIYDDKTVSISLVPIADGLTLVRKKSV